MNNAIKTDWFSAVKRQEEKVARAGKRLDDAQTALDREVQELNRLRHEWKEDRDQIAGEVSAIETWHAKGGK